MYAMQEASWHEVDIDTSTSGIEIEIVYLTKEATKFDVHLMLRECSDGSLHGDLIYSTDLFEDQTMERFANHFVNIVQAVSSGSMDSVPIGRLPMLSREEANILKNDWNQSSPQSQFPPPISIAHTILKTGIRFKDHIAIEICGDKKCTYDELIYRAKKYLQGSLSWERSWRMEKFIELLQ